LQNTFFHILHIPIKRRNKAWNGIYIACSLYQKFHFLLPRTLVKKSNVIANSTVKYYRCAKSDSTLGWLLRWYSTCPRNIVQANTAFQFRESGWLHWTKFRRRTHFRSQICMCHRVHAHSRSGRKRFYRYEFNFHTNSSDRSLFLSLSLSPPSLSSYPSNTRQTECYVPMQTWFAGYLERNKGGEHSNTAPYLNWLSVIQ